VRRRIEITLAALESIAQHVSGLPGRKSLIWVSSSFPSWIGTDPQNLMTTEFTFDKQIRHVMQELNQADVAMYPVDARGLFTDPDFSAANQSMPIANPPPGETRLGAAIAALGSTLPTMLQMADQTGGRAFVNTNDIWGAIRSAFDDAELTYTLGYYPSHGEWNGEFRPIRVVVDRPGAKARYRRGYFASVQSPNGNLDAKSLLYEAGHAPLEATAVGVTVRLRPFKSYVGRQLAISISVDPNDLTFEEDQGHWTGQLDIWAAQYSGKGKVVGGISKSLSFNLPEEDYRKLLRQGLSLYFNEQLKRGAKELAVVVRDAPSGKVGWVKVPLHKVLPGT
jgi:hypothetical protein